MNEYKGIKSVTLRELKVINEESIQNDFNRNFYFYPLIKDLKKGMIKDKGKSGIWRGMKTRVVLIPLMVHNHKQLVECEPHMRVEVFTNNLVKSFITLDVPFPTYNKLDEVSVHM